MARRTLKRILLVEDDPDIQTVTSMALGSFGGYTLILLDVMMPGMDGLDTLRALRDVPATAATPVIFLTARVQPADVAKYNELDSLAVIRKPFEPTALVDTIHEIWARYCGEAH